MYASDEELASWAACPRWTEIRATLLLRGHYNFIADMDRLIERVRREVWKDFSGDSSAAPNASGKIRPPSAGG